MSGQWVDASNNSPLSGSTVAEFYAVTYTTTNNSEMQVAKAIITPSSNLTVAMRILSSNGTAEMRGNQSYAIIKQLNSCGGGGGSTTIVNNNVTASNGLTATSNDVKLGGTLSEATNIATAGNNLNITGTGNVGIGTASPTTKLHIDNATAGAVRITDGTQGNGRVLTSDANGVASWSPTPATSLYFVSASPYVGGQSDYQGTVNPVTGVTNGERFISNGVITNLGPATTITQGTQGISYRIPVTGLYRMTLYIDAGYTGGAISMRAYRSGGVFKSNSDGAPGGSAVTMINIWALQAGDIIVPLSTGTPAPSGTQLVETTFTVERVN